MTDQPCPSLVRAALAEGRTRVFGRGFDLPFRLVLLLAWVGGALALGHRGALVDVAAGLVAMAFFLAMPFVVVFVYVVAIAFIERLGGRDEMADPTILAVLAAVLLTLAITSGLVAGIAEAPLVGQQLRSIFL